MSDRVIPQVVSQHAEEAAFLWLLRDGAATAPHFTLADLARLDDRVEAHLEGLRVAGAAGEAVVRSALLDPGGPGEAFAAAVLAFEGADAARVDEVLAAARASRGAERAVVSALGWREPAAALRHARPLLDADDPALLRVGIAASTAHRKNPGLPAMQRAFASPDLATRARALRAVGELGLVDLHLPARAHLKAKDPACRFWAAWSSALVRPSPDALAALQEFAEAGGPFAERAAQVAARKLPARDARLWLKRLVKDLRQTRTAVAAAGALADPDAVPFLIDQMKTPRLARAAGESFSLITGADLPSEKLDAPRPEGADAGPTDDPADENVAADRDENLPWPDPALVQKWWNARQATFDRGVRYLLGRPVTEETVTLALATGYQRQRAAAALERALLRPGRPLFEVRAPGRRQQGSPA